jgi:RNA polymerase sigma-70 factor (ECF subfamily)
MDRSIAFSLHQEPAPGAHAAARSTAEPQPAVTPLESERFEALYRENYALIGSYLLRRTGDRHATEDLLSEVFLSSFKGLARYADRGVPVRRWLYRIATNAANQWLRNERRRPKSVADVHALKAPHTGDDANGELIARVQRLASVHQDVLMLHYVEGLSLEEVGQVLALRTGAVKSRLARARQALRAELERKR